MSFLAGWPYILESDHWTDLFDVCQQAVVRVAPLRFPTPPARPDPLCPHYRATDAELEAVMAATIAAVEADASRLPQPAADLPVDQLGVEIENLPASLPLGAPCPRTRTPRVQPRSRGPQRQHTANPETSSSV